MRIGKLNDLISILTEISIQIAEKYADSKEMGRIMLRVGGVTIATGHVTEIIN